MIKRHKTYSVECDGCRKNAFENEEISSWENEDYAVELAECSGWMGVGIDHHFCDKCFHYDDEGRMVLKTASPAKAQRVKEDACGAFSHFSINSGSAKYDLLIAPAFEWYAVRVPSKLGATDGARRKIKDSDTVYVTVE